MPTDTPFAAALKRLRAAAGWTQKQLAAFTGVTPTSIQHWENGRREPSLENVRNLATALGVTADRLLQEDTPCPRKRRPRRNSST